MLTVKQVASALGIDERSVRDKLTLGTLKGTKKTIGQKDQWFVHQRDLDAELARRGISPVNQPPQQAEAISAPSTPPPPQPVYQTTATMPPEVEEDITDATILESLVEESVFENEGPEVETTSGGNPRSWRSEDLEAQVAATAEKFMKPLIDRVQELTKDNLAKDLIIEEQKKQLLLLPDLETQRATLLRQVEAERKAAEIQYAKVADKEQEAKALEAENEELRVKAQDAALSAAKLADLEKVVQELQKPKQGWFGRLFSPRH